MSGPSQTPLLDLLRGIPLDARLIYNYPDGASSSIPVGHLAKEAIAAIEAAHAKGRAEGLREAQRLIDNTDLGALSGLPEQVWVAQMLFAYSKSIERLLREKP